MRVCEDPTLNLFILGHFCPILNLQGCKLTELEKEYINRLQKDDLIELIMLYDNCMESYAELIKSLV